MIYIHQLVRGVYDGTSLDLLSFIGGNASDGSLLPPTSYIVLGNRTRGIISVIYVYDRADGVLSSNTRIFDNCRENHTAGLMAFIVIIYGWPQQ